MTRNKLLITAALAALSMPASATEITSIDASAKSGYAATLREVPVRTHPSQGDVSVVEGGVAHLATFEGSVFVDMNTTGLNPGHAHTLWFVTIGNPAACASQPCSGKDVLLNSAGVQADVGFGGGAIAEADGTAHFAHFQPEGDLKRPWFGNGFAEADTTEIHLIIKDHGPVIGDRVEKMLSSFRDACTDKSIKGPFPEIALADGKSGPNTCAMVQFSAFTVTSTGS